LKAVDGIGGLKPIFELTLMFIGKPPTLATALLPFDSDRELLVHIPAQSLFAIEE
jgi:hypothetical protein